MEEKSFDLVVLGAGPAGYGSAIRAAMKGGKVCLVEKENLGGTCLNWGCFPTKSMLRDAILFSTIQRADFLEGSVKANLGKVIERKNTIVRNLVHGIETVLVSRGVNILEGDGKFFDRSSVVVTKNDGSCVKLRSKKFIIATGTRLDPSPFNVDGERIIGSRHALNLSNLPATMAIVGAGRRGTEFAAFFGSLGCSITLIEGEDRILPIEDVEISHRLRRILTLQGIKIMVGTEAIGADVNDSGRVTLNLNTRKGSQQLEVEKLLVPGKRAGNTDLMGLEKIGLVPEKTFIRVNSHLETGIEGIYAPGDVNGRGFFAHKALAEGLLAVDQFTGRRMKMDPRTLPRCTYTYPEVGSIGMTQREAEEKGEEFQVGKFPMGASGRALTLGQDQGVIKILSGKRYGEILGIHILAPLATELIAVASLAMRNELGIEELKAAIYGHPTLSESFFESALDVSKEAIHFLSQE